MFVLYFVGVFPLNQLSIRFPIVATKQFDIIWIKMVVSPPKGFGITSAAYKPQDEDVFCVSINRNPSSAMAFSLVQ